MMEVVSLFIGMLAGFALGLALLVIVMEHVVAHKKKKKVKQLIYLRMNKKIIKD